MFRAVMVGLAVAAGAALVVSPSIVQNKVGVSISNTLTTAKDGRVLRSSVTPKPSWRGPLTFVVTVGDSVRLQQTQATFSVVDTVWEPYPSCTKYRTTVYPAVVLTASGDTSAKRDSLFRTVDVCRKLTATELAVLDSFPAASIRKVVCSTAWERMPKGAADTALAEILPNMTTAADSLREQLFWWNLHLQPPTRPLVIENDSLKMVKGYQVRVGVLAKNRYTGLVEVWDSDPEACEHKRLEYQLERAS